jgi:predicted PurR-regulated permease PerM
VTLRTVLVAACVAAAIWLAYSLERIIVVLLPAMFLAYVIGPLVERAQWRSVDADLVALAAAASAATSAAHPLSGLRP